MTRYTLNGYGYEVFRGMTSNAWFARRLADRSLLVDYVRTKQMAIDACRYDVLMIETGGNLPDNINATRRLMRKIELRAEG